VARLSVVREKRSASTDDRRPARRSTRSDPQWDSAAAVCNADNIVIRISFIDFRSF